MVSPSLDWNSLLIAGARSEIEAEYIEPEIVPVANEDAKNDLVNYLTAVFSEGEHIAICTDSPDGAKVGKINHNLTAGELIDSINSGKPMGEVIGDTGEAGAWIGFNPLDGQGSRDANITAYRHAMIQSDEGEIGHQLSIIRALRLPCSALIHSGGRSIHAIVKIDAAGKSEYRDRVDYLYKIVAKAGLQVDGKHRYPSRLTRLPGVRRGLDMQYLIPVENAFQTWEEWFQYVEDLHDDLPDIESLSDTRDNPPELDPEIIRGVLRKGHKMLISGPSKAGKSWGLQSLCIAVAEGSSWMGFPCVKGRALYVNCELARASGINRFHILYEAKEIKKGSMDQIDVWNIRGTCAAMSKLAPKLIRRAKERDGYSIIVVDPLYKVEEGDENAAHVMMSLFNLFEMVALKTGAALVYAHHHSKGDQGGKKAGDRGSGSGVIHRDPDALLDLIELVLPSARRQQLTNRIQLEKLQALATSHGVDFPDGDVADVADAAVIHLSANIPADDLDEAMQAGAETARLMEGFRLDGSLREFPKFKPREVFFRWPCHVEDQWQLLADAKAAGEEAPWMAAQREKEKGAKERKSAKSEALDAAISASGGPGCNIEAVAEHLGLAEQSTRFRINGRKDGVGHSNKWIVEDGRVCFRKQPKGAKLDV